MGKFRGIFGPGLVAIPYRTAENFRGVQFSRIASLQSFRGLIFADAGDHAHYTLYNRTYFAGLIFADSHLSVKTTKIRPHENFPLYGIVYAEKNISPSLAHKWYAIYTLYFPIHTH
jgi:hypothetical protein